MMRSVPEEAVKALTEALKDKDTRVRMEAASALGRLKSNEEKNK
ncbi:MAG TPA: HEAT repeat domain-containing protein [Gemmataceae bacterium]|jgi:HEAT repeat protein